MSKAIQTSDSTIRLLHVDDDVGFADMATAFLEREDGRIEAETAGSATDGLTRLADSQFDCVISDYDMPERNGIEFLRAVREDYPDLPFVLCTGKGSEEVASDAISAGATDYIQKDTGRDHFKVLANRIGTIVERTRSKRRHQQLVDAVETAREGIGILDADGYHISVNQAYADIYRTAPEELIGEHWTEIHPDAQLESVRAEISTATEQTGNWHGRMTGLRADGTTFTQDCVLSTTATGMTIRTVRDVSEQLESEEHLSRYRALIEVLRDPVYVLDDEGRFDFVNDAFVETFGYGRCEVLGNSVSVVKDEQAIEQGLNNLRRVLSSDEPDSVYFETEIQTKDGESIPCEDHMTALPYDESEFDGSVGILRDVSNQKKRERELKRRNERLDEFARVVSHDLRSPLNVAEGNLELLAEERDSERIDSIRRSLTRMGELIEDLLRLSRVGDDTSSRESVDLAELCKNCWHSVETADATLHTNTDRTVDADRSRLAQLFENLIRNAVEHTSRDVTVTLGELEGGFYVEDDGSGIPEERRGDVFEAGYTTTQAGTGFGLSIVNQVVEAHGWDIRITDSTGDGTRFEITNVDLDPA